MEKINLFFAIDGNYCPFLSSALHSILKNANPSYKYDIYILHNSIPEDHQNIVVNQVKGKADLEFIDVIKFVSMKEKLDMLADRLVTRDYYTKTTYYRLFIPNMFKNLDKALYLDVDIIVDGDISELYSTNLGDNLVGAIPDAAVANTPVFGEYVEKALGVKTEKYFNAGILLMNLKKMREWDFEGKFIDLLSKYSFRVAQDQDYLNVLTKDQVKYVDYCWNVMPVPNNKLTASKLNLVHYNMSWKPWIFEDTLYADLFWKYAKECPMYQQILDIKNSFTDEKREGYLTGGANLLKMAGDEANDPNNYFNKFSRGEI